MLPKQVNKNFRIRDCRPLLIVAAALMLHAPRRSTDLPVAEASASGRNGYNITASEEENHRQSRSGSLSARLHEAPTYGTTGRNFSDIIFLLLTCNKRQMKTPFDFHRQMRGGCPTCTGSARAAAASRATRRPRRSCASSSLCWR